MTPLEASADLVVVTTTVADADAARRLAHAALQQRLAACVQVEVVASHYRWEGALHEETEHRLTCKTLPHVAPALMGLLRAQHPYDVPELVACSLRATAEYAEWVRQELQR